MMLPVTMGTPAQLMKPVIRSMIASLEIRLFATMEIFAQPTAAILLTNASLPRSSVLLAKRVIRQTAFARTPGAQVTQNATIPYSAMV
jgi:hypothetical protein